MTDYNEFNIKRLMVISYSYVYLERAESRW